MTLPVPLEAVAGNELWEGFHRRLPDGTAAPYPCPAKVPTIGIGTTVYPNGHKVKLTDPPITRETAREYLAFDLRNSAASVERDTTVKLHELQFASLIMFSYNVGTAAYHRSTLRYFVNRKEWDKAAREFMKWVNGGGRRLQGLVNRRDYERLMFLRGASALGRPEISVPIQPPMPERSPQPAVTKSRSLWKRFVDWTGL